MKEQFLPNEGVIKCKGLQLYFAGEVQIAGHFYNLSLTIANSIRGEIARVKAITTRRSQADHE
jgi:hypothetical protein